MACSRAGFPTRCARTATEPFVHSVELRCTAKRLMPRDGLMLRLMIRQLPATRLHIPDLYAGYRVKDWPDSWNRLRLTRIIRQNLPEGFHDNVDDSVLATLHHSDDLRRRHGFASRHRNLGSQGARSGLDPDSDFRRAHAGRHSRSPAAKSRGVAKLSDLGASALPAGRDQAGDAAVFLRERKGRHAVFPRHPRLGLSARQDGTRQAAVRHPGGRLSRRL